MLFWRVALWCLVILLFGTSGTGLPINDIYIYLQPSKKKKELSNVERLGWAGIFCSAVESPFLSSCFLLHFSFDHCL